MVARRAALLGLLAAAGLLAAVACKETNTEPVAVTSPPPSPSAFPAPTPLVLGSAVRGRISSPGASDLYSFRASAGDIVQLDLDAQWVSSTAANGNFNGKQLNSRILLYDTHGALQGAFGGGSDYQFDNADASALRDSFVHFTVPPTGTGTYTVAIDDVNGKGGPTGYDYFFLASKRTPQPQAGGTSCSAATLLPGDGTYSSGILPASTDSVTGFWGCANSLLPTNGKDVDFAVFLTSGQTVQIVETSSQFDGRLVVVDYNKCTGNPAPTTCLVGADGASGSDGVVFTPAVTGTYFVFVDGDVTPPAGGESFLLDVRTLSRTGP